ncbi:nitric oxide synthase oxygenase [Deinococcus antarcticus]|uniref:Nitric oxide synthase oxygenase n=1 Tax=Deinococcus antarcticus TaxID=1298767 RepID=A0ABV8A707_9DEIO
MCAALPTAPPPAPLAETLAFLDQFYDELPQADPARLTRSERLKAAAQEYHDGGRFTPTSEELTFGARVAWRNSTRCIGRLFWPALQVRDLRHVTCPDEVFAHLLAHLQDAYHGGAILPVMSVFGEGVEILNPQLLRYAGYRQPNGEVIGDPENVALTEAVMSLGWRGAGTPFDVLPLALRSAGWGPQVHLFPLPSQAVQEVTICHPEYPQLGDLGLRWPALPVISDAALHLGGATFGCVPFNGWYMQTEIAARNLTDETRYNLLPRVAGALGLDTRHERTLWRDRALLELNVAVLHSFRQAGVKIVDHHSAARQFQRFQVREARAGREVRGRWSWLIPPMSPATTPVWREVLNPRELRPNFTRRPAGGCPLGGKTP